MTGAGLMALYNFTFLAFTNYKVKNALLGRTLPQYRLHVVSLFLVAVGVFGTYFSGKFGVSAQGTCSVKGQASMGAILIQFVYVAYAVYTLRVIDRALPKSAKNNAFLKKQLQDTYKWYIIWTAVSFIGVGIIQLLSQIFIVILPAKAHCSTWFRYMNTLSSFFKMLISYFVVYYRYKDPMLRYQIQQTFMRSCYGESMETQAKSDWNLLHEETNNARRNMVKTMICAIMKYYVEELETPAQEVITKKDCNLDAATKFNPGDVHYNFGENKNKIVPHTIDMIDEDDDSPLSLIRDNSGFEGESQFESGMSAKLTVIAPEVFKKLIKDENKRIKGRKGRKGHKKIDFKASLDPSNVKTVYQIDKSGQGQGGASRQFFFVSHDKKLLIKTLVNEELEVFQESLYKYYKHFEKNPDSLIAKVLGVFKISFDQDPSSRQYNVIVMENIQLIDSQKCQCIFDIKGSTHSRQVIKENTAEYETVVLGTNKKCSKILKDFDFHNKEEYLLTTQKIKHKLLDIIDKDAKFFMSCGFIDYSLIVFKVDRTDEETHKNLIKEYGEPGVDTLKQIESLRVYDVAGLSQHSYNENNKKIYWHIGIIDYMQTYTCKKMMERRAKRFLKKSQDPSSCGPVGYANRFLKYWECHILAKETEGKDIRAIQEENYYPQTMNNYMCCCCFT